MRASCQFCVFGVRFEVPYTAPLKTKLRSGSALNMVRTSSSILSWMLQFSDSALTMSELKRAQARNCPTHAAKKQSVPATSQAHARLGSIPKHREGSAPSEGLMKRLGAARDHVEATPGDFHYAATLSYRDATVHGALDHFSIA